MRVEKSELSFSTYERQILMEKLQQTSLNINILAWVGSYLTSRKQTVVINGSSCIWGTPRIHFGPPSIYIDDLTYLPTSNGSHSVLYADDLPLFHPLKGREDFQLLRNANGYNRTMISPLILPNASIG